MKVILLPVMFSLVFLGCAVDGCCGVGKTSENLQVVADFTVQGSHDTKTNLRSLSNFLVEDTSDSPRRLKKFFGIMGEELSYQVDATPKNFAMATDYTVQSFRDFPEKLSLFAIFMKKELKEQSANTKQNFIAIIPFITDTEHAGDFIQFYVFPGLVDQWNTTGYYISQIPEALAIHWYSSTKNLADTFHYLGSVVEEQLQETPKNFGVVFDYIAHPTFPDFEYFTSEIIRQTQATPDNLIFLADFLPKESLQQLQNFQRTLYTIYDWVSIENSVIGIKQFSEFVSHQVEEGTRSIPGDLQWVGELLCPPNE